MPSAKDRYLNSSDPNVVVWEDTTLRDGAQAHSRQILPDQAASVASKLEALGIDVLELPMPTSSLNRQTFSQVTEATSTMVLAGFARDGIPGDVDALFENSTEAVRQNRFRVALLTPVAECLRDAKGVTKETAARRARDGVIYVCKKFAERGVPPDLHMYFEGATEVHDLEFLDDMSRLVIDTVSETTPRHFHKGMSLTLDYPDTHGTAGLNVCSNDTYGKLHKKYSGLVRQAAAGFHVMTAAHCHGDGGLAEHNSVQAWRNGANQIGGTMLGVGERVGNADLAILIPRFIESGQRHLMNIDPVHLRSVAQEVAKVYGMKISPNRAFIGEESISTSAGIHARLLRENPDAYVKRDPSRYGASPYYFKVGPAMGRSGTAGVLEEMGAFHPQAVYQRIFEDYQAAIESGNENDYTGTEGRLRFIEQFIYRNPEVVRLIEKENGFILELDEFVSKSKKDPEGEGRIYAANFTYTLNGEPKFGSGISKEGTLPIVVAAIASELDLNITLLEGDEGWESYDLGSKGAGSDVVAKVIMVDRDTGEKRIGFSIDPDEKVATVQATLNAISSFSKVRSKNPFDTRP